MVMRKITLILLLGWGMLAVNKLYCQTLADYRYLNEVLDDESFFGVGISRSHLANPAAPSPENHSQSAFTLYFDIRKIRLQPGKASIYFTNQLLGDLLLLLQRTTENPSAFNRSESSSISSGLLGWINVGWNLSGPGKFQPFLGFNHNDYFIGSTYVSDTIPYNANQGTYEPQGYYFAAGPMAGFRASLGKFAILESRTTYSLSYLRPVSVSYAVRNDDYPKPHFLNIQLECMTKWGLFGQLQTHRMINRGDIPNNTRRWDATLGFRFML